MRRDLAKKGSKGSNLNIVKREKGALSPEKALEKALNADDPQERVQIARAGLSHVQDLETQILLLRQVYVGEIEQGHFDKASLAIEQAIEVDALPELADVLHHDAARAFMGLGEFPTAIKHLLKAFGRSPDERDEFHLVTLVSVLFSLQRLEFARSVLDRALPTKSLLLGALAALCAPPSAETTSKLSDCYERLQNDSSDSSHVQFLLAEIALARGERARAVLYFEAFLARTETFAPLKRASLAAEILRAQKMFGRLAYN
jgi:tetratricopeptide (TPR) repeat protein